MRKVIVSNLVTLDGFFEGLKGELDWFVVEGEFFDYVKEMFKTVDTILYGRKTYEHMAAYWPNATDNDATITHMMNKLPKIVLSKTLSKADWNNSRIIKENIPEEIHELKKLPGKDIVIFGSGEIVSYLSNLGLIDEYRIILNPVILGKGSPMFKNIDGKIKLNLFKTRKLNSGVIVLYYQPEKIKIKLS
ncbi:MAG: dihydrofolate reductase [Bacteroidetes bacterium]|nr:dihydrofolate reductase [Bacteroidota bacterium]